MRLFKHKKFNILEYQGGFYQREVSDWDQLINRVGLYKYLVDDLPQWDRVEVRAKDNALAPIAGQEIWAAGVTYQRSKDARMEEAKEAGGDTFYDKVYDADRPELFFKATAARTVGTGAHLFIRKDSTWNVPEPELTLFITSEGTIEGYTIGNDMSSRSIEGENPLYLPQAKVYERCAGLGPCLYITDQALPSATNIGLEILRKEKIIFSDKIEISRMKRDFNELVDYLYRECDFPYGCFLMTGTGIVPADDFTLSVGDEVRISIDQVGTLINTISERGL